MLRSTTHGPAALALALLACSGIACVETRTPDDRDPAQRNAQRRDADHDHQHASVADARVIGEADLSVAAGEMATAAQALWTALTDEQKAATRFEMTDEERLNWHFIPKARKGLSYKVMTPDQRLLAHAFLSTGLSTSGLRKSLSIMSLEQILRDMEKDRQPPGPTRDPEQYFWSVFGTPGKDATWAWRVEGHHLSLNFTIVNGKAVAAGPAFMGTNPGEVREGPRKGLRLLGPEEDWGRALVKSLTDDQRKTAVFLVEAPKEMVTAADKKVKLDKFEGIAVKDLTPPQRQALIDLVGVYANRYRSEVADWDLKRIEKAGWDKVYFGWAGGFELGQPHYYRIHGPTFLIEYDNVQNNANHAHTVWRDLEHDFGGDLLRKHYEDHKGDKAHGHAQ